MNITNPSFTAITNSLDIVGFNLQTSVDENSPRTITFGQVFAPGALRQTDGLNATIDGISQKVQIDAKTFNTDGSISFAVLTLEQPSMVVGHTLQGMLSRASAVRTSSVDLSDLLSKHNIDVTLNLDSGAVSVLNIGAKLQEALSAGTAEVWMSGPLATQARVSILVSGSLRILATITAFADGTFSASVGFNNDVAMSTSGGVVTYSAAIKVDGKQLYEQPQLTQQQYQDWNTTVWSDGKEPVGTNVQHDSAYLEKFGAIPNFDLLNGVNSGLLDFYNQQIQSSGWGSPLSNNDVYQAMPATGGRPDIGITTAPNAAWLITQDIAARTYSLGQADASGAAPWNYWDNNSGTWLNTDPYPNIWTDGRGGTSDHGSIGPTQPDTGNSGWILDTSHQPDLSYYAFMMTGDEKYLDGLNAQASYAVTNTWEAYRGSNQLVVGYDQVRASAWNLREIDEAAWANQSTSLEGKYFQKIADANWKWLVEQIPAWTVNQGQAYGQIEGYAWGSRDYSRPWMQDYFAGVAAEAAKHGNNDALTFLKWESNFLVGRFLNGENGFNPRDGVSYTIAMGPDSADGNVRYKTWAEIGTATVNAGESNGTGYGNSIGDYGILGLNTLSDIISVIGSLDAIKAYNWLLSSMPPFTSAADRASDVQFNIIPKLPPGWAFASDGTIYLLPVGAPIGDSGDAPPSPTPIVNTPTGQAPPQIPATVSNSTPPTNTPLVSTPTGNMPDASQLSTTPAPSVSPMTDASETASIVHTTVSNPLTTSSDDAKVTFRFFDTMHGTQFMTSSITERDALIGNRPDLTYEGKGIGTVAADPNNENVAAVFRFFSKTDGTHFFTTDAGERDKTVTSRSDLIFEGSGFNEHLVAQTGDTAVYRFFDAVNGSHFFTSSDSERSTISATRPDMVNEGIAFYAPA